MGNGGCANCGGQQSVTIGGKDFCANCGLPMVKSAATETPPPAAPSPAPTPTPTPAPAPAPPPTPAPPAPIKTAPTANRPVISDLRRNAPSGPGGQVLDLRANQAPKPAPVAPPVPVAAVVNPLPTPRIDLVAPSLKTQQRATAAQATAQSSQVSKFAPVAVPAAAAAAEAPVVTAVPSLPNQAATAHEAMQKLIQAIPGAELNLPSKDIAPTALSTEVKYKPAKTTLALASIVLASMGAYIWFTNYPKMAVKLAGSRAGLEATYPSFLPSSYKLTGAVAYASGEVTYKLASPSADSPLSITQRQTGWDSRSLLENFVKQQNTDPITVNSQGLTIYFYGNKAAWVNHGIWYTLEGTERLNQEQILKIAYSL